jgi:PIN domain nuclease of toxin-antitoxin system
MKYVLDTHAFIWHLTDDPRLGDEARRISDDPNTEIILPSIVLAEAKHIADKKRVSIKYSQILEALATTPQLQVFPIDETTIAHLPSNLDIHDSLIVATAMSCNELYADEVILITRDQTIIDSDLVRTIW